MREWQVEQCLFSLQTAPKTFANVGWSHGSLLSQVWVVRYLKSRFVLFFLIFLLLPVAWTFCSISLNSLTTFSYLPNSTWIPEHMSSLPEKMSSLMTSCLSPRPILSTFIIAFISWHSSVLLSVKLPCLNRFQQIASNNLVCGFVCQLQDFQFVLDCFLLIFDGCLCCCHDFVLAGSPFCLNRFFRW